MLCVLVCACFQLHVDRTCEGVKRHRVLSSRELPVSGSKVGASSVLRSGPMRASVEPKTCASGSKVGASSVLRSGPIRASVEPKTCASGSKDGASSVVRSGPVPVFCVY